MWDIGGVLIEDPKHKEFWKGAEGSQQLRVKFGMHRINTDEFVKQGSKILKLSQKEFLEEYKKAYWTGERNTEVVKIFKNNKLKNYIYSDTNPIHLQYLKKIGQDLLNEAIKVFTDKRKKYYKSYKEILKAIHLKPSEVIFIDNKEKYTDMAKKLGINVILYQNPKQLKRDLGKFI